MMPIGLKKAAIVSILALSTAPALLMTGCKRPVEAADEAVATEVQQGQDKLLAKPDGSMAIPILSKAANDKSASSVQQALANTAAGQAEILAADVTFHKIDQTQNQIQRLLGQIAQMAAEVQRNNIAVAGLMTKTPAKALATIDKNRTSAKTGDQGVWVAGEGSAIPALAAVDQSIAATNQKIDALKAKHGDLEKQRADALTQAAQLTAKSEEARGKESLDLYTQAAEVRKTAGDLSTQLQDLDAQLAGMARELSIATAQKPQIEASLVRFGDQTKALNAAWDDVKKRIDDLNARSKIIVEGDPSAPPPAPSTGPSTEPPMTSIAAAGDRIAQLETALDKDRAEARADLEKADGYFDQVAKFNRDVVSTNNKYLANSDSTSPSRPAWQWMIEISNDADPNLQKAQVAERLARLYADATYYTSNRLAVAMSLKEIIKTGVPKSLEEGTLAADVKTAQDAATNAFKKSEEDLNKIIEGPSNTETGKSLVDAASVVKMVEQYARYAFGKVINEQDADKFSGAANKLALDLTKRGVDLPLPLPPEIAPPPPTIAAEISSPTEVATTPGGNDTPEQAQVRATYNTFQIALFDGDAAKAKSMIVSDPTTDAEVDVVIKLGTAIRSLGSALDAKFPGEGTVAIGRFRSVLLGLPRIINVAGETATVSAHPGDPNPDTMKKVEGSWKIVPNPEPGKDAMKLAAMKGMTGLFESLTNDVTSGKYATVAEYQQDAQKRLAALGATSLRPTDAAPPATAPATAPADATATPAAPAPDATVPPATQPADAAPSATAPRTDTPSAPPAVPPAVPPTAPPKKKVRD